MGQSESSKPRFGFTAQLPSVLNKAQEPRGSRQSLLSVAPGCRQSLLSVESYPSLLSKVPSSLEGPARIFSRRVVEPDWGSDQSKVSEDRMNLTPTSNSPLPHQTEGTDPAFDDTSSEVTTLSTARVTDKLELRSAWQSQWRPVNFSITS